MIIFAWDGFPQYAARCVGAFVKSTTEKVVVVATRPAVPIEGMEKVCNCPVIWLEGERGRDLRLFDLRLLDLGLGDLGLGESITLFVSGWSVKAFTVLAKKVRAHGGRVICILDNGMLKELGELSVFDCLIGRRRGCGRLVKEWAKEVLRSVRFRLMLRRRFDGFFVPGKAGRRLMRFYGVSDEQIVEGLYAADDSVFHDGKPLAEREKKIIYVGQFIERKNVRRLVEAFEKVGVGGGGEELEKRVGVGGGGEELERGVGGGWELHLYGSGPLKDELAQIIKQSNNLKSNNLKSNNLKSNNLKSNNPQSNNSTTIHLHDFCQPEELAAKYRESRVFCLPSLEEHWGLVVHEAALSGCVLCLSDRVCAAEDLCTEANGVLFDPQDTGAMAAAFTRVMSMADADLRCAQATSLRLAADGAGIKKFVKGVVRAVEIPKI